MLQELPDRLGNRCFLRGLLLRCLCRLPLLGLRLGSGARFQQAQRRADDSGNQCQEYQADRHHRALVPPHELPQPVRRRRRTGQHRLVVQVALDVGGEAVGRLVAPGAVLLQRLHHDPVQLAADQRAELLRARSAGWRRSTASDSLVLSRVLGRGGSSSRMIRSISSNAAERSRWRSNGVSPVKQFVEQHAQRVDVAARVDVQLVELGLLGAHVLERADHLAELR